MPEDLIRNVLYEATSRRKEQAMVEDRLHHTGKFDLLTAAGEHLITSVRIREGDLDHYGDRDDLYLRLTNLFLAADNASVGGGALLRSDRDFSALSLLARVYSSLIDAATDPQERFLLTRALFDLAFHAGVGRAAFIDDDSLFAGVVSLSVERDIEETTSVFASSEVHEIAQ